jgi:hypothetical protein
VGNWLFGKTNYSKWEKSMTLPLTALYLLSTSPFIALIAFQDALCWKHRLLLEARTLAVVVASAVDLGALPHPSTPLRLTKVESSSSHRQGDSWGWPGPTLRTLESARSCTYRRFLARAVRSPFPLRFLVIWGYHSPNSSRFPNVKSCR